ncbi:carboxypeptidase-like regulatory domain-containing protein [Mucilaginibacter sp.]|uniref:carboxypeptidase-like regulatory domain-containing protein n=1 Tax=Mucilaginibacter sp. TaxID=1882438 RepID=UPI00262972FA|nr:carboxypeptidase-like regulatory domain-containing protein [Mucilaginibacter sp.]MDB4926689.1 hypothetical protein [Mucilaginibacter sp.]
MKKFVIILVFVLLSITVMAQVNSGLLTTLSSIAGMRDRMPIEKLYLQLDKPYYALGDTLRFKAYLMNADFLKPSIKSGLLYVELDDNTNKCIKRIMVPVASGLSWGDIALIDKDFPEGSYTLRAYTNWMLNFGEDYVFKKSINISALSGSTLVKAVFKADKGKIQANLRFTGLDKSPYRLKDMQLRVMNGKHSLFKNTVSTGMDGSMDVNFDLPENVSIKDISIQAQEIKKGVGLIAQEAATLVIPVTLNRPENTDVQFMPEGGNMVNGINTRVGFKAISEDGKAVDISGKVFNSKNIEVVTFKSTHKGMGSFELTPVAGESYNAKVTLAGNIAKSYPLPAINTTGTTLRIEAKEKELEVSINATPDVLSSTNTYYLIAQTRGLICYTAAISFKNGPVKKTIGKDLFPTGIAHFTLFNSANQPLNERIAYISHNDNLQISVAAGKPVYSIRDSIALAITVKDNAGKPVRGNFSLAVTDDSQVRADSIGSNIISNLLMTSDLKGTVEEPGWYFEKNTPERIIAFDNLLLTQGWVGYDWKAIFGAKPPQPQFAAEPEFIVQGKVTNIFNKGVEKAGMVLFSRKPEFVRDTVTDKDGRFTFRKLFPIDTAEFKIQARNRSGKSFNIGIEVNTFIPPRFKPNGLIMSWYVNSDTVSLSNSATKAAQQHAQAILKGEGHMLKEVVIKEKKIVKESHNLNGPGEADQVFDEQDLLKAGKMTLGDLLKEKVKGFNVGPFDIDAPLFDNGMTNQKPKIDIKSNPRKRVSYRINEKEMRLIIDGTDVDQIDGYDTGDTPTGRFIFIKHFMDYFSAEDIKGIEVMFNSAYNSSYGIQFLGNGLLASTKYPHVWDWGFIEITTRSGKGPFMKTTTGTYLYKPLPFTLAKQFYRPRYTIKNAIIAMGTDLRSTIHWAPSVVTDKEGKATVSFFSADKPANYTLILEGTDLTGAFGYNREKIKVSKK